MLLGSTRSRPEFVGVSEGLPGFRSVASSLQCEAEVGPQVRIGGNQRDGGAEGSRRVVVTFRSEKRSREVGLRFRVLGIQRQSGLKFGDSFRREVLTREDNSVVYRGVRKVRAQGQGFFKFLLGFGEVRLCGKQQAIAIM